jgi:hypothetical protein
VEVCPECNANWSRGYPFCLSCGAVSPALTAGGPLSLEIHEVPSQQVRNQLLDRLRDWFPAIDVIEAEKRLKSGRTLLLRGVDATSAKRVLSALRDLKVDGNLTGDAESKSPLSRLWNRGLVVSAVSLGAALIIGGWTGIVFLLAALASPVAGALLKKQSAETPLVPGSMYPEAEYWLALSAEYEKLIQSLHDPDRQAMKNLFKAVFELQSRLRSDSLPSAAAGFEHGDLHDRLRDSLTSAVEIGRRMLAADAESGRAHQEELQGLADALSKTYTRFTTLETGGLKAPEAIEADLEEITNRIDRIVKEARQSDGNRAFAVEKNSV